MNITTTTSKTDTDIEKKRMVTSGVKAKGGIKRYKLLCEIYIIRIYCIIQRI